jgi:hypothetical protein
MLAGTEGARLGVPFWSFDSQFIGYAAGTKLKKVGLLEHRPKQLQRSARTRFVAAPGDPRERLFLR